jgi:hypothetical protein
MGFTENIRQALLNRIGPGKRYPNNKRMADELDIDPSQLNRFLKMERGLNTDSLGHILDRLGARIVFGDETADAALEVCFRMPGNGQTNGAMPELQSEDYLAVPLAASPVAAGPGLIPEDKVEGWVLVWRHQESIRFRSNLVAVEVGKNEMSMTPTLHPGDIVLVDRNDRDPSPAGKIMLVCEPGSDGGTMVKRVNTKRFDDDVEIIFYSDNSRDFPPTTYRLGRDYDGDITRAIGGNVVWAWSDMTRK